MADGRCADQDDGYRVLDHVRAGSGLEQSYLEPRMSISSTTKDTEENPSLAVGAIQLTGHELVSQLRLE